jgi:putative bacteriocin precursor
MKGKKEMKKELKKLKKNFVTETDDLRAYITCRCPACACGCQDISDSHSVQSATKSGYRGGMQEQSAFWNR